MSTKVVLCFLILNILGRTFSLEKARESKNEVKNYMAYSEIENIVNSVLSHEMINYDFKQETISLRKKLRTATTSLRPMLVQLAKQKVIIDDLKNSIEAIKLKYDTAIIELSNIVNVMDEDYTFEHDSNIATEDNKFTLAIDESEQIDESENTTSTKNLLDMLHQSDLNVAFSGYLTSPKPSIYHTSNDTILRCDGIIVKDGDSYDPGTGTFTTPVRGTYLFTLHYSAYPAIALLNLMVNDNKLMGAIATSSGEKDYHMMGQNTAVVRLQEGDTVWIQADSYEYSAFYADETCCRYTTLSGALIY